MEPVPTPNFFIVGAPKSGTTALYSYLRQHPDIFMSKLKEPQFFAADICGEQRNVISISEYLTHFNDARTKLIGEASTCYLASNRAAHAIREFCPTARIIVMLRNPIDVMYAAHSERVFDGIEHVEKFAIALECNEVRKWRSGRFKGQDVVRVSYRELTQFSQQVERFIDAFGPSNVHVLLYDDFAKNPSHAYKEVLAFLGAWPNHECAFDVIHANRQIRSTVVRDFLQNPPKPAQELARAVFPRTIRQGLGNFLNRGNIKFVARPSLDQQFRKRLESEYEPEVQQLSRLIDRDLSHWVNS
ncbi:MAG: sulfotransferase [Candidatus Sulfotelmatobacter sp.]